MVGVVGTGGLQGSCRAVCAWSCAGVGWDGMGPARLHPATPPLPPPPPPPLPPTHLPPPTTCKTTNTNTTDTNAATARLPLHACAAVEEVVKAMQAMGPWWDRKGGADHM